MAHPQGSPVWYERITGDADAAEAFYGAVVGWSFSRPPGGLDRDYRIAAAPDGEAVCGVMDRPAGVEAAPSWFVYFGVDDPDAVADAVAARGGTIHVAGTDIPGIGRFAVVADPQGIPFYVMRGVGDDPGTAFVPGDGAPPGHAVWNELSTPDPAAAIAFYGEILGIRQEGGMPMGPLGDYQFLHVGATCIGAVMGPVPDGRNAWQVYFLVPEIDAAATRVAEAGGRVVQGQDPIPGGAFALVAEDFEGARFGLVGPSGSGG